MCSNRQVFDPNPELTSSYTKPMHSCKVPTTRQGQDCNRERAKEGVSDTWARELHVNPHMTHQSDSTGH